MAVTVVKAEKTALTRCVEDYLSDLKARGRLHRTVRQAAYVLGSVLLPWCREAGVASVDQLDQKALNAWTTHLHEVGGPRGPLARRSVFSYTKQVNQFLAWATKAGERENTAKAHVPRLERRILDVLDRDEVTQLEQAARTERDKILIRLMADCGLRLSEALGIKDEDLQEQGRQRFVRVHGKGARDRLVPVMPALYRRLVAYSKHSRPKDVDTSHVFTSLRRGSDGAYAPMAPRTVEEMLRCAAEAAGITKRVHPHGLRHHFCTFALRSGRMNVVELQRILGHSDLSQISATYSHLVAGDLFEAMGRLHSAAE